jgi:hypothetical protein
VAGARGARWGSQFFSAIRKIGRRQALQETHGHGAQFVVSRGIPFLLALGLVLSLVGAPTVYAQSRSNQIAVSIASPVQGAGVAGTVTVTGSAHPGNRADLTSLEIAVDSQAWLPASGMASWGYSFDSTAFANGDHTLSALATDSRGRTARTTISVSFNNPDPNLSPSPLPSPSPSPDPSPSASPSPSPDPSPSPSPSSDPSPSPSPSTDPSPSPSPSPAPTCTVSGATGATSTQLHPADQPPYNVVADGITDDFAGIQQDINDTAAAGGGIVTLPSGTLIVNGHLVLKSNVKLMGAGNAASSTPTIIKAGPKFMDTTGPNGGYPIITTNGAINVTIANLVADQSGDTLNGNVGGRLAAYMVDIRSSSNALVDAISTRRPFTYSIAAVGSNRFCIRGSDTRVATSGLYDQLDGIHVLDSSFGDVDYNNVDQRYNDSTDGDDALVAHSIKGPTHDIAYVGNKARGGSRGDGMQIAVGNYPIYNLTIQNNEIYDSPEGIRTGYYDGETGAVHDITVGGSTGTANYVHDLRPGIAFPSGGNAIWLFASPYNGGISYLTATYNTACNAGQIQVDPGIGMVVSNNSVSAVC